MVKITGTAPTSKGVRNTLNYKPGPIKGIHALSNLGHTIADAGIALKSVELQEEADIERRRAEQAKARAALKKKQLESRDKQMKLNTEIALTRWYADRKKGLNDPENLNSTYIEETVRGAEQFISDVKDFDWFDPNTALELEKSNATKYGGFINYADNKQTQYIKDQGKASYNASFEAVEQNVNNQAFEGDKEGLQSSLEDFIKLSDAGLEGEFTDIDDVSVKYSSLLSSGSYAAAQGEIEHLVNGYTPEEAIKYLRNRAKNLTWENFKAEYEPYALQIGEDEVIQVTEEDYRKVKKAYVNAAKDIEALYGNPDGTDNKEFLDRVKEDAKRKNKPLEMAIDESNLPYHTEMTPKTVSIIIPGAFSNLYYTENPASGPQNISEVLKNIEENPERIIPFYQKELNDINESLDTAGTRADQINMVIDEREKRVGGLNPDFQTEWGRSFEANHTGVNMTQVEQYERGNQEFVELDRRINTVDPERRAWVNASKSYVFGNTAEYGIFDEGELGEIAEDIEILLQSGNPAIEEYIFQFREDVSKLIPILYQDYYGRDTIEGTVNDKDYSGRLPEIGKEALDAGLRKHINKDDDFREYVEKRVKTYYDAYLGDYPPVDLPNDNVVPVSKALVDEYGEEELSLRVEDFILDNPLYTKDDEQLRNKRVLKRVVLKTGDAKTVELGMNGERLYLKKGNTLIRAKLDLDTNKLVIPKDLLINKSLKEQEKLDRDLSSGLSGGDIDTSIQYAAGKLGIESEALKAVISFETGGTFRTDKKNDAGSSGTGLIQFMDKTAQRLGTTTTELSKMSVPEQMEYVIKYLEPYKDRIKNIGDLYMAVLWPAGVGKKGNYILFRKGDGNYAGNAGLDKERKGYVTRGDAVLQVMNHYKQYKN